MSLLVERWVAEQAGVPLEEVARIYRMGRPWPLLPQGRRATSHADAETFSVSVQTAHGALESLGQYEREHLVALSQAASHELLTLDDPEAPLPALSALVQCSSIQGMWTYSERVAAVLATEPEKVYRVYVALVNYAIKHPDWDPEDPDGEARQTRGSDDRTRGVTDPTM